MSKAVERHHTRCADYLPVLTHCGQGLFKCPGFYDDDHYHYCNYSSWHEERTPWSLAPAEEVDRA